MNRLDRLIRRVLAQWQSWQTRRRLEAATKNLSRLPEMRSFAKAEQEKRSGHKRGVVAIQQQREAFMLQALKGNANG